jgi:hypothetical protein
MKLLTEKKQIPSEACTSLFKEAKLIRRHDRMFLDKVTKDA